MIPTVLSLFWGKLNSNVVFAAILASLVFGAPVYAAGAILKNPHLSVTGSILVVLIGLGICVIGSKLSPASHEMMSADTRGEVAKEVD